MVRIRLPYIEYSPEILEYLDGKRTNRPEEKEQQMRRSKEIWYLLLFSLLIAAVAGLIMTVGRKEEKEQLYGVCNCKQQQ